MWLSSQRELSEAGLKGFGHLLTAGKFKVKGLKLLSYQKKKKLSYQKKKVNKYLKPVLSGVVKPVPSLL